MADDTTTNSIEGPTWTTSPIAVRPRHYPQLPGEEPTGGPEVPFGEGEVYVDMDHCTCRACTVV